MSWVKACPVVDIEDGEAHCLAVEGCPAIAVWNNAGTFLATADTCTHEEASLSDVGYLDDGVIECSLHMARYDVRSGEAVSFPAETDLATFPTKVEDGTVYVEVP